MLKQTQLTSSVEVITPEIAKAYLSLNGANRPIKIRVIDFYADQMKKGEWRENGEAICFTADGKLADGQHRLSAVVKSGCTMRFVVSRGCEEESFPTYDSGVNRTPSDIFATAMVDGYKAKSAVVNRYFSICRRAKFINGRGRQDSSNRNKYMHVSKQNTLSKYMEHRDVFDWASKAASRCRDKLRLFTEAEIGGTMAYLRLERGYDEACVQRFFDALHDVRDNENTTITKFRQILLRDLGKVTGTMTGAFKQALLIKIWNAYAQGIAIARLRYDPEREEGIWFLARSEAAASHKPVGRKNTDQSAPLFAQ